jgi:hypothetical protein
MPRRRRANPRQATSSQQHAAALGDILNAPPADEPDPDLHTIRARQVAKCQRCNAALSEVWPQRGPFPGEKDFDENFTAFGEWFKRWGDVVRGCGPRARNAVNLTLGDDLRAGERRRARFAIHVTRRACDPDCTAAEIADALRQARDRDLRQARDGGHGDDVLGTLAGNGWLLIIHQEVEKAVQSNIRSAVVKRQQRAGDAGTGPLLPAVQGISAPAPSDQGVSANGVLILKALFRRLPERLSIFQICGDLEGQLSERTIGPELQILIGAGLVHRPQGERGGATLTPAGKRLVENLPADPSTSA